MGKDTSVKVRYQETDKMGVVYHGNYFTWFDIGRTEFFRSLGMLYRELEEDGVRMPVIEAKCKYNQSDKYDNEIIIGTKLVRIKGVRLKFEYKLYRKEDQALIAEGYTVHAFVNKE